ncbi:MAG: class I SAM-dependent methyltransferase family protein [Thermoplasmatota archaeon]
MIDSKNAERIRQILLDLGHMDHRFQIMKEGRNVLIPIIEDKDLPIDLLDEFDYRVVEANLMQRKKRPRSYKDLMNVPQIIKERLPSSFDILGDVAVIKLEKELLPHSWEVGKALLDFNRNIRSAVLDKGVKGDLRIRELELLAGDPDLETVHIENNLRFKLDPSKVYFSPRLATERMRIAKMTGKEKVLDMFAGVGPFSLNIARHGEPEKVVGIDLNPLCIEYFRTNISLNSVEDKVEAHLGDAADISGMFSPYDRIIMNLPHTSIEYFDRVLDMIEEGMVHLYSIIDNDTVLMIIHDLIERTISKGKKININDTRVVHNYSPSQSLMVFDIYLK